MATYTPTSPIDHLGDSRRPPLPPAGGGDDNRGDGNAPNYGARLRRARLGLACGIATVCMVFISLTSAYIVRQGLPTFDGNSNSYVRDWGKTDLPWGLLGINTALLLLSSVTIEFARRSAARRAALAFRLRQGPWQRHAEPAAYFLAARSLRPPVRSASSFVLQCCSRQRSGRLGGRKRRSTLQ